ncbi:MAG: hypothetical protein OEQ53_05920 [Saprospiraceae bacterium]|nr:hypothetical protein [Saprospiraceae bacterium]
MRPLQYILYLAVITCLSLHLSPSSLYAQNSAADEITASKAEQAVSVFESLMREDMIHLTLKTNTRKLVKEKMKEAYQPAELTYLDLDGNTITRQVDVKTRGNLRLNVCRYPPIRIKFSKEEIKRDGLISPHKLKLVSCCEPGDLYQQLVLKEYLVYKLYNVLTDNSFRVQLATISIEDTEGKDKPRETFAFVIEDEDEMADRMTGQIYDPKAVTTRALHPSSYDLLAMFQFMVGNTDWFVLNKHNVKFVLNKEAKTLKAVPYDFDYAGLVKSPYAVPNEKMPITNVMDRFFIGKCRDDGQYDEVIQHIMDKKEEIMAVANSCEELNRSSSDWVIKYLQRSYDILENPKAITKEIERGCDWTPLPKK